MLETTYRKKHHPLLEVDGINIQANLKRLRVVR